MQTTKKLNLYYNWDNSWDNKLSLLIIIFGYTLKIFECMAQLPNRRKKSEQAAVRFWWI